MKNQQKEDGLTAGVSVRALVVLMIVVISLWLAQGLLVCSQLDSWTDRGTFGDMFGAINSLFAGLAFAGVVYAILLQRRELALQREELRLTRDELQGQKEALEAQSTILDRQTFENTFFQFISLHHQMVHSLNIKASVPHGSIIKEGRKCFEFCYRELKEIYAKNHKHGQITDSLQLIDESYCELLERRQADIGHYFRNLYNILKFIENSRLEDKVFYANLLRAQLSSHEICLLFYNCLSRIAIERFKPLVEEFSFLKGAKETRLLLDVNHMDLYDESAFLRER